MDAMKKIGLNVVWAVTLKVLMHLPNVTTGHKMVACPLKYDTAHIIIKLKPMKILVQQLTHFH